MTPYECVVIEMTEAAFVAVVRSVSEPSEPDLEAEIAPDRLMPEDRRDVVVGSILDWTDTGIALRRETWTDEEIARVKAAGAEPADLFATT